MTASPLVAVPPRLRSTASGNGTVAEMWEGMGQCGEFGAGGAEGIRTPDLLIANETLYQLSYIPPMPDGGGFTGESVIVQSRFGGLPLLRSKRAPLA